MKRSYSIFADYHRFYLWDKKVEPGAPADYTDEDVQKRIKAAPNVVVIQPERDADVPVEIEIFETTPSLELVRWEHVAEASLELTRLLMFKGGTSLSKAYRLIERFSEDIDLIPDWRVLSGEDPLADRSKAKQEKLNTAINEQAKTYIASELFEKVTTVLGDICKCAIDVNDPHVINIRYLEGARIHWPSGRHHFTGKLTPGARSP